jgi:Protein of unknown function (DUF1524)
VSRRTSGWTLAAAAAALAVAAAAGCDALPLPGAPGGAGGGPAATTGGDGSAGARLGRLTVARAGSMRGYSRARFPHWRKIGENCDVRDAVLKRDGTKVKYSGCNVVAGTWRSPYDGVVLDSPATVDVDHLVPLANAWRSGAAAWSEQAREDFANDLDDPQLVAVSASSNRAKGDQDPSTWRPRMTGDWCVYATDWIAVKTRWKLTVTTGEKAALADMLETC